MGYEFTSSRRLSARRSSIARRSGRDRLPSVLGALRSARMWGTSETGAARGSCPTPTLRAGSPSGTWRRIARGVLLSVLLVPRGARAQVDGPGQPNAERPVSAASMVSPVVAPPPRWRTASRLPSPPLPSFARAPLLVRLDQPAHEAPFALSGTLHLQRGPERRRGARRGAVVGAIIGGLAGVAGFAALMHAGDEAAETARLPCTPETPCQEVRGPNVGRLFLPFAYLIAAGTGAAAGALVGAGVGAAIAR